MVLTSEFISRCWVFSKKGDSLKSNFERKPFVPKKVILSAGGWVKDFIDPSFQKKFKICRQVLHWVKMKEESPLKSLNAVFMWGYGPEPTDFLYGFPSQDQETVKIASEQFFWKLSIRSRSIAL